MNTIDFEQLKSLDKILKLSQQDIKAELGLILQKAGYSVVNQKGFLYAAGTMPVLLVAHMDTVHEKLPKFICRSDDGRVWMSPQGIGGDDRAGVYMILQIIKDHHCHILFCEDEEIGQVGARAFTRSGIRPEVNYIVELDRRGANDAVFYSCKNKEFEEFIHSFNFKTELGSVSDISHVAPYIGAAAVNISAGYFCEHRNHEYIRVDFLLNNIERVSKMVGTKTPFFEYREAPVARYQYSFPSWEEGDWRSREKYLYFLPEQSCVKYKDQELRQDSFMMDEAGAVYIYYASVDAATPLPGASIELKDGSICLAPATEAGEGILMTVLSALEIRSLLYGADVV